MTTESNKPDTGARAALLDRVDRSWNELVATVDALDERQLTAPGPDGWSVKDHLSHLTRWEEYLLARLDGRDGRPELGLESGQEGGEDEINAALQRSDAGRPLEEVRRRLTETHARVAARLETLEAADLEQRLPVIEGNTSGHFAEHTGWIRALTKAPA